MIWKSVLVGFALASFVFAGKGIADDVPGSRALPPAQPGSPTALQPTPGDYVERWTAKLAGPVRQIAFLHAGSTFAVNNYRRVELWDANASWTKGGTPPGARMSLFTQPPVLNGDVASLSFGGDDALLAVAIPGKVRVVRMADRTEVDPLDAAHNNTFSSHSLGAILLASLWPDSGRLLVVAGWTVTVFDVPGKTVVHKFDFPTALRNVSPILGVAVSPDRAVLATGHQDGVRLWNVLLPPGQGTLLANRRGGHAGPVRHLAFSPNGRILATGSDDKTVRLWDTSTRSTTKVLSANVSGIVFVPGGQMLASIERGGGKVTFWGATSGAVLRVLKQDEGTHLGAIAFSSDGRFMATGSGGGILRVWKTQTEPDPAFVDRASLPKPAYPEPRRPGPDPAK